MRSQVRAAMIFNGHSLESLEQIDEETFTEISVMFADGVLGGKGVFDAIAPLTAGVFNYLRPQGVKAYKTESIFPWITEYEKNPDLDLSAADKTKQTFLSLMMRSPGFNMEKFNGSRSGVQR